MNRLRIYCDCPKGSNLTVTISNGIVPIVILQCRVCKSFHTEIAENVHAI